MTIRECLFTFRGRMFRQDYWLKGVLVLAPVSILITVLNSRVASDTVQTVTMAVGFATMYPLTALWVKRLHDRNRSGWLAAVPLISILLQGIALAFRDILRDNPSLSSSENFLAIALFAVAVALASAVLGLLVLVPVAFFRGTVGPNRFGEDPLAASQQSVESVSGA